MQTNLNNLKEELNIKKTELNKLINESNQLNKTIQEHQKEYKELSYLARLNYVGKTYKFNIKDDYVKYYRIIKPEYDNDYRFTALSFIYPIMPNNNISILNSDSRQVNFIYTESFGLLCNRIPYKPDYVEITEYEYNTAFDNLIRYIRNLK